MALRNTFILLDCSFYRCNARVQSKSVQYMKEGYVVYMGAISREPVGKDYEDGDWVDSNIPDVKEAIDER